MIRPSTEGVRGDADTTMERRRRFAGRAAVITGAGGTLGGAIARALALGGIMSTIDHVGAIEPDNLAVQPTPRRVDRRSVRRYRIRDRVLARVRTGALDRALASGIPTDASPALSLRARALTRPLVARELGQQLCRIVQEAHEPLRIPGMRVRPAAERVLAAEDDLRLLASRLQSGKPMAANGIAKVHLLLSDGTGPLFDRGSDRNLGEAIREATWSLGEEQ